MHLVHAVSWCIDKAAFCLFPMRLLGSAKSTATDKLRFTFGIWMDSLWHFVALITLTSEDGATLEKPHSHQHFNRLRAVEGKTQTFDPAGLLLLRAQARVAVTFNQLRSFGLMNNSDASCIQQHDQRHQISWNLFVFISFPSSISLDIIPVMM